MKGLKDVRGRVRENPKDQDYAQCFDHLRVLSSLIGQRPTTGGVHDVKPARGGKGESKLDSAKKEA